MRRGPGIRPKVRPPLSRPDADLRDFRSLERFMRKVSNEFRNSENGVLQKRLY